jgi:hypothetical protein
MSSGIAGATDGDSEIRFDGFFRGLAAQGPQPRLTIG